MCYHSHTTPALSRLLPACRQEFREACYELTGFKVEMLGNNRYRLQSMYAETADDNLLFQKSDAGLQLLDTEFSRTLPDDVVGYLQRFHSIPAFLSTLTLELFSRQTMM